MAQVQLLFWPDLPEKSQKRNRADASSQAQPRPFENSINNTVASSEAVGKDHPAKRSWVPELLAALQLLNFLEQMVRRLPWPEIIALGMSLVASWS